MSRARSMALEAHRQESLLKAAALRQEQQTLFARSPISEWFTGVEWELGGDLRWYPAGITDEALGLEPIFRLQLDHGCVHVLLVGTSGRSDRVRSLADVGRMLAKP